MSQYIAYVCYQVREPLGLTVHELSWGNRMHSHFYKLFQRIQQFREGGPRSRAQRAELA